MKEMTKLGKILNSSPYQFYVDSIAQWEKKRMFCRHDRSHFLDTARVAYILFLEKAVACPELDSFGQDEIREMIYTVGFLHDIGRYLEYEDPAKDHAQESCQIGRAFAAGRGIFRDACHLILKLYRTIAKKIIRGLIF